MIPGSCPIIGGSKRPPVLIFNASAGSSSAVKGTQTFSVSFGSAPTGFTLADRYVIVGAAMPSTGAVSTIGGITPTLVVLHQDVFTEVAALYIAKVPTGASGNVVLTNSNGGSNWLTGIACWSIYGAKPTAVDTNFTESLNGSMPLTVPSGALAVAFFNNYSSLATWSGGVTQDSLDTYGGSLVVGSASTHTPASAGTISPKINGGSVPGSAVDAAFR